MNALIRLQQDPAPGSRRAIVIGASLAGLLAARVLAGHYDEILLLERDRLSDEDSPRKGIPHAIHPHGLLARGREVLEQLFPGLTEALLARGATAGDAGSRVVMRLDGSRFAACSLGATSVAVSRSTLESELRRRTRALARCRLVDGVDVLAPICEDGRVTGVHCRTDADAADAGHRLGAALVVDCTGRGSRTPSWLRDWGFEPAPEEKVTIDLAYTSAYFRRSDPAPSTSVVIGSATPTMPYPSILIAQEPDAQGRPRWVAGVGGYAGDHVPRSLEAIAARARATGNIEIAELATRGELLGEPIRYRFPYSLRRRYERLRRFPAGYLVIGDALASFNPVYGQGMTVAACEALALKDLLAIRRSGDPAGIGSKLAATFFAAAARTIDTPWQLAAGGDLSLASVEGHRTAAGSVIGAYMLRLRRRAIGDPVLAAAFMRVMHLLAPPASLFAAPIAWRVLRPDAAAPAPTARFADWRP